MTGGLILVLALAQGDDAQVRETATVRVPKAQAIARDAVIVRAVKMKNAVGESLDDIQRKDAAWTSDPRFPLRSQLTNGACAGRLRALVADDPFIVEGFVADEKGAIVCATTETSDYWQGDEAKWRGPFKEGRAVLVEDPALDLSSGTYAVQLSVPVSEGNRRLGSLTLTLKVPRGQVR